MSLTPRVYWGSLELTAYPYALMFGSDLGAPEPVTEILALLLQDGEVELTERVGNRTLSLPILTEGASLGALATAEAALALEARKPLNTLRIDPGDGVAPETVYDTFAGSIVLSRDDRYEQQNLRVWNATIRALPSGRDLNPTTVQAASGITPVTPTVTSIDAANSTTGWTGRYDNPNNGFVAAVTPTAAGTSIYLLTSQGQPGLLTLTRTGSVSMGTDTVIAVDYKGASVSTPRLVLTVGGSPVTATLSSTVALGVTGWIRSYFTVSSGLTFTALAFTAYSASFSTRLDLDQVSRQNAIPVVGTNRQLSRSLLVGGSARARASLAITADATKTLGDLTLLYTRSATTGLQPPLRPYRFSSSVVTPDSTVISGAYNALSTAMVFNIPANRIQEAGHNLVLRLRATTAGTYNVTWTAALASSANADLPETAQSITGTTAVIFAGANTWQTNEVGLLQLPTVPVASDSTAVIRLTLIASNSVVQVDEAWLFDLENGELSWVNTTGLTRLEVRTADLTTPRPTMWGGTVDGGAATALVRADWRAVSYGTHVFEPGNIDVFTVTSGTEGSSCSATYYRAWHTHAAA